MVLQAAAASRRDIQWHRHAGCWCRIVLMGCCIGTTSHRCDSCRPPASIPRYGGCATGPLSLAAIPQKLSLTECCGAQQPQFGAPAASTFQQGGDFDAAGGYSGGESPPESAVVVVVIVVVVVVVVVVLLVVIVVVVVVVVVVAVVVACWIHDLAERQPTSGNSFGGGGGFGGGSSQPYGSMGGQVLPRAAAAHIRAGLQTAFPVEAALPTPCR